MLNEIMKRLILLILAAAIIPISAAVAADTPDAKTQTIVVFASPVGDKAIPTDQEIVSFVIEHMRSVKRTEVLAFNLDLPAIQRAVLERRIPQEVIGRPADPKNAVRLADLLGAQYALVVQGLIVDSNVSIYVELHKVAGGGRWAATAASQIATSTGPTASKNRSNAISNAASSAVSQVAIQAFGQSALGSASPSDGSSATLPTSPIPPPESGKERDIAADYAEAAKQADAYLTKADMPNAVVALKQAINLQPDSIEPRMKLAQTYANIGLITEAVDECERALLFKKDDPAVYVTLARLYVQTGDPEKAAKQCQRLIELDPQNVDARLTLGDLYWNQSKLDNAMDQYVEAARIAPRNPTAHERLAKLYLARKMYAAALEQSLQAKLIAAGDEPDETARYKSVAQVMQDEFNAVLGVLQTAGADFGRGDITREDYYQECKNASGRIEALANYLSTQTAPAAYKAAHAHAVLGVSLLAQAAGYAVSYLETERKPYLDQAKQLQIEAQTEMGMFAKAIQQPA